MAASARWLAGGPFYETYQAAGPYQVVAPAVLYPPTALLLFVPFTVLPAPLWWAIPLAITGSIVWSHRPHPLAWPVLAMCLAFPTTPEIVYAGNPALWILAALALASRYRWPSVLVLLKPTLAPFALFRGGGRSWWIALAVTAVLGTLFLPLWPEYVQALRNGRDPNGLAYSLNQVPTMLIPVVAWIARRPRGETQHA